MHARFLAHNNIRENKGFSSSGVDLACLSLNLDERPIITLKIEGKDFPGLLDTGADRSIIRKEDWPKRWPLQASSQTLQGLGYAKAPEISVKELTWTYQEGQKVKFQPFVVELPITLWGRDVLNQMNFMLTTEYSEASRNMMRNSGFIPGKGLGKRLQGHIRAHTLLPGPMTAANDLVDKDQENAIWIPERLMRIIRHEKFDPDTSDKPDSSPDQSRTGDAVVGSDQNVADPNASAC
ncbi:hypothetical protein STEG23_028350 [Scotinomys teguina]